MKIDLTGKTAVVTGATGDLGRAIARGLAGCGADVAVHYRANSDMASTLVDEIMSMGRKAVAVQADVGSKNSVEEMGAAIRADLRDPDIVIANAVEQVYPRNLILEENRESYESQFKTCVLQNVFMSQVFVPAMQKQKWGRYIGINTECTMQCTPTQSAYVSGKGGQDRVLRVLANEIGADGITVNQVAPGWTISDRYREDGKDVDPSPEYTAALPLKRRTTDQDIANAVCFLASDLAKAITGLYLPVCSGDVMPRI